MRLQAAASVFGVLANSTMVHARGCTSSPRGPWLQITKASYESSSEQICIVVARPAISFTSTCTGIMNVLRYSGNMLAPTVRASPLAASPPAAVRLVPDAAGDSVVTVCAVDMHVAATLRTVAKGL